MVRASMSAPEEALFGPNAQRLEVSLLGARTAAVLRRIVGGSALDEYDLVSLNATIDAMSATAEAIEIVAGGRQLRTGRRTLGFGAIALAVESSASSVPPADVPRFLRDLADGLRQIIDQPAEQAARALLPTFSLLADVAMRQAGSVGEGGGMIS